MRAAVCSRYGGPDAAEVRTVPKPVPKATEVLVRVRATTVSSADARIRAARFPSGFAVPARLALGIIRPRQPVLGTEFSGVIEDVGASVTTFRTGDNVFAATGAAGGGHAEYVALPVHSAVAPMPGNMTFEEAAAISFGGATALYYLRDVARVQPGERVLVIGASGTVGIAAVQLARYFGAHVTAVCSARNAPLLSAIGAHAVLDYRSTDVTTSGERWEVILDAVGDASLRTCRHLLNKNGRLLLLVSGLGQLVLAPILSRVSGFTVSAGPAPERREDLIVLKQLCEAGLFRIVIDSRYALDDIAQAHARVDSGRKVGSVVVTMP